MLHPYRQGQEDQLGALGLVVNAIVLWNTVYLDRALGVAEAAGIDVTDDDIARRCPLSHDHLNLEATSPSALTSPTAASNGPSATPINPKPRTCEARLSDFFVPLLLKPRFGA